MQFSGEIYDYIERTEGCFMIPPHHFHPTNGVRPHQNKVTVGNGKLLQSEVKG